MANFAKNLEEASDEELYLWINQLAFNVVPLASDELTRRTLNKLQETIVNLDKKNERLQVRIFWLTVVSLALAATQFVQAINTIKTW